MTATGKLDSRAENIEELWNKSDILKRAKLAQDAGYVGSLALLTNYDYKCLPTELQGLLREHFERWE